MLWDVTAHHHLFEQDRTQQSKIQMCKLWSWGQKHFLDEASFPAEDDLNDFEFGQVYMNWLTLIETVSDPIVDKGWHNHHKRMSTDCEFLNWAPAWHAHDHLLHSHFILKPFILDPSSPIYKQQFEC